MDAPPTSANPSLYETIRFDPRLEADGLRRLSELDVEGCRRSLTRLAGELELDGLADREPLVIQLLLDVLQRLQRRVSDAPHTDATYQGRRLALIEAFALCRGAEDARSLFLARLKRLLAEIGGASAAVHTVVDRARGYIDGHYMERVFLSSVATRLNVSPNYLSRLFREHVGVTLTHYVQQKRVERARMLLATGNGTISEIAYRVGYQNYRDFYRNFVKLEGASPRVVRRRLFSPATG